MTALHVIGFQVWNVYEEAKNDHFVIARYLPKIRKSGWKIQTKIKRKWITKVHIIAANLGGWVFKRLSGSFCKAAQAEDINDIEIWRLSYQAKRLDPSINWL